MTRLAGAYKEEMDEFRFSLYWEFLGKRDFERTLEVVNDIIRESKWFPKIAEFEERLCSVRSTEEEYFDYLERQTRENEKMFKELEWMRPTQDGKAEAKRIADELGFKFESAQEKIKRKREEAQKRENSRREFLKGQISRLNEMKKGEN